MSLYAHVSNGSIDITPQELPPSYQNYTGLQNADAAFLQKIGWFPVIDQSPSVGDGQIAVFNGYSIGANAVTVQYNIVDAPPPPPPPPLTFTYLQFRALFAPAEQQAVMTAALKNTALFDWIVQAASASAAGIDMTSPIVKSGLDSLVAAGLITSDREAAILAGKAPS